MKPVRKLRRAQTVTPFGVGAIFDVLGESFVAEDITRWKSFPQIIEMSRLTDRLGVNHIRTAPPAPDSDKVADLIHAPGVPFQRFPTWLFCSFCRTMTRRFPRDEEFGEAPKCTHCHKKRQLTPMRFVMICGNGHLDDVNWKSWAHSSAANRDQQQCGTDRLEFLVRKGVGGGLRSLVVRCRTCKAERSLDKIASKGAPRSAGLHCPGKQPWQYPNEAVVCDAEPIIVQRGASNVHFSIIRSAIDIPPDSNYQGSGDLEARVRADADFQSLERDPDHPFREGLVNLIAARAKCSPDDVLRILASVMMRPDLTVDDAGEAGILREEWLALSIPADPDPDPRNKFIAVDCNIEGYRNRPDPPEAIRRLLANVVSLSKITRLREVRALVAFTRYTQDAQVRPDLGTRPTWLPGIETFGEGIFFSLDESRISSWELEPHAINRARTLEKRRHESFYAVATSEVTPRFLMLHTLAHLLIRQMTYETGYSSSALRERIYSAGGQDPMAGILIYTAAGDSEGTLGGLARQADPARFASLLSNAIQQATWCSLDPVCGESEGQGSDALSLSACHACTLVSETSCTSANVLLDRGVIVEPAFGFFADSLGELTSARLGV